MADAHEAQAAGWFDRPMRWGQLTLAEDDPGRFDPDFWLDYFRRCHCDAVCLSAGGIVAYYPTAIRHHHRSDWLGDTDPFGQLAAGCRAQGMVVVARTDPHAVREEVRDAHPDWIQVTADGQPRRHWANPALWVTCPLGPYNFEFMTEVHGEIERLYRVDGIFSNRWAGHGVCYCDRCRQQFREASGQDLPRAEDPSDPAYPAYVAWRNRRLLDLWGIWDGEIRAINPGARFLPNGYPDRAVLADRADIFMVDHQGRSGQTPAWDNGMAAKQTRAVMGRKPIVGIFGLGISHPTYRWMDSVTSEAEIRTWAFEGIAHGFRPWFTKFSGTIRDPRWLGYVERIYQWHHKAEAYLRNEESLARVGLVYSEATERLYRGRPERPDYHKLGMYQALLEARVPFDMVNDRLLDAERIDRYRLLVLPNVACLSDGQCAALRAFVARGGSLLATFETSLYDEQGRRRPDFGLADVFGVSAGVGEAIGPLKNSYLAVRPDPDTGGYHPVLAGLEEAGRIVGGIWRLEVAPRGSFPSPVTLVPPYPDLPMEDVYPRVPSTDVRMLYLRGVYGSSRVAYVPFDLDRGFYEVLAADHGRLLGNLVAWAANEEAAATVNGPGLIDVAVWRQRASLTVHLVNLTNPMLQRGAIREHIPVGPLEVAVALPEGRSPRGARLLVGERSAPLEVRDGRARVAVPSVLDYEVVAIDLG